jgi:tetratricopeptide (TPR) repeat protein
MNLKGAALLIPLCALVFAVPSPVRSADTPVERAMKQVKRNHYRDAAMLYYEMPSIKTGESGSAHLSLGVIFMRNAELYHELNDLSIAVHLDYLEKISSQPGKDRSLLSKLYLGETLLAASDPGQALVHLRSAAREQGLDATSRGLARIAMGTAYSLLGKGAEASKIWAPLGKSSNPVVLSELAWAFARTGRWNKDPESICDRALTLSRGSGRTVPMRVMSNCIAVFTSADHVKKALDLVQTIDMKAFSDEEDLGMNKTVRFYHLSLLANLARLYQNAGIFYLEKAAADPRVAMTARYYLARAHAQAGRTSDSDAALDAFIAFGDKVPERQHAAAMMTRAGNLNAGGKDSEGIKLLNRLTRENNGDPHMLAEAVLTCGGFESGCTNIISSAATVAMRGEGRKFSRINFALGRYHLRNKDLSRGLTYLEAGRDKSNKNRIEFNEPSLLTDLARAYYRTKKFSEALEILFGMSVQFPAVRQIQNAMQGIYSIEQKSAGDVKVL